MSDPDSSLISFRRTPASVRRLHLEAFARLLCDEVSQGRPFDCLIADDRELQRLNREFRGKDYPTDVLSFPSGLSPRRRVAASPRRDPLGSLAISHERAAAQAAEHGHSLETELRILLLHGVLHLTGMDHETDQGRMARAEARWRTRLGLPDGLIARAHR